MLHTDAIWRACRIILDVRLHRGEIGVDEAVDFLVDQTRFEQDNARSEGVAHVSPDLRSRTCSVARSSWSCGRASSAASARRSRCDFHDTLLKNGSLPISHRRLLAGEGI